MWTTLWFIEILINSIQKCLRILKRHIMLTIFMAISPFDVLLVGDRFILYFYALMSKNNLRNIILLLFIMITLSVVVTIQTHIWCFNRNSTLSINGLLFNYQLLKKVIMAWTLEVKRKKVSIWWFHIWMMNQYIFQCV